MDEEIEKSLNYVTPDGTIPEIKAHYDKSLCHLLTHGNERYAFHLIDQVWKVTVEPNYLEDIMRIISPIGRMVMWPRNVEHAVTIDFDLRNVRLPDPRLMDSSTARVLHDALRFFDGDPGSLNDLVYKNTRGDIGEPTGDGSNLVLKLLKNHSPNRHVARDGEKMHQVVHLAVFDSADSYKYIRDVSLAFSRTEDIVVDVRVVACGYGDRWKTASLGGDVYRVTAGLPMYALSFEYDDLGIRVEDASV